MAKDYYKILGVDKGVSKDELKKAYRKLAHQYHPDKAGGDEAKFKEINEAYRVLSDDTKRQQYDQFGQTFEGAGPGFGGFSGFQGFGGGGQGFEFDLGDIFGEVFGGGRARTRARQGRDMQIDLDIPFRDAVFGAEKTIKISRDQVCDKCKGNGAEPGSKIDTCKTCGGSGQEYRNVGFGIRMPSVCTACRGKGQIIEKKCAQCHGQGVIKKQTELKVKIPAGIDNGQTIRLSGEGEAIQGGVAGDLYVNVVVLPEIGFQRDGYNIINTKLISYATAALGGKVGVETIDGPVALKIPSGTPSGKVFVLKGKGVPHLNGHGRGNHLVEIKVKVPTKLSRKQKKLLEQLEELE